MRSLFITHHKLLIVFTLLLAFYFSLFTFSGAAFATCDPNDRTPECAAGIVQVGQLMTRMINISVTIAFMALTVWLVWSAVKFFIVSGGEPKNLAHAWSSVTWAFMGLFFMVLAWLALKLIYAVTGANVTQFCLGFPPYCI